jgi:chromosome segregation ATPase
VEELNTKLQDQDTEIQRQVLVIKNLKDMNKELTGRIHDKEQDIHDKDNAHRAKFATLLKEFDTLIHDNKQMREDIRIYKRHQAELVQNARNLRIEVTRSQRDLSHLRHAIRDHDINSNGHHGG